MGVVLIGLGLCASSHATVLIFEDTAGLSLNPADFDGSGPVYGDRVTGTTVGDFVYLGTDGFTPNIAVGYAGNQATPSGYGGGYGTLSNVVWGSGASSGVNEYSILFTADPGWYVTLSAFHAAAWSGSQPPADLRLTDGGGNLLWQFAGPLSQATFDAFDFGTGFTATSLRLTVSQGWWHGVDNVRFSQTLVPEPATLATLALGLGALAARRRRR